MAVLTKKEILERIKIGSIAFAPVLDKFQLQAHSVDLRIGFPFIIPKSWTLTPEGRQALKVDYGENRKYFDVVELESGQYFEMLPGEFVGISTLERIKVPQDIMGVLYPRSSINRRGLSVDLSGIIDAGFEGSLLVPVRNSTTSQVIRIYPGERFCQIVFEELKHKVEPKKSRWHQKDVVDKGKKEKAAEMKLVFSGELKKLKTDFSAI